MRIAALLVVFVSGAPAAWAGAVRGSVSTQALEELATTTTQDCNCFWRFGPRRIPTRPAAAVVLEGAAASSAEAASMKVELHALSFQPNMVAVPLGSKLEFHNRDGRSYSCSAIEDSSQLVLSELKPGEKREIQLDQSGEIHLRCHGYPFMALTVVVVESAFTCPVDAEGRFSFAKVPAGTYQAKLFAKGKWMFESDVQVAEGSTLTLAMGPAGTVPVASAPASADSIVTKPSAPDRPAPVPVKAEEPKVAPTAQPESTAATEPTKHPHKKGRVRKKPPAGDDAKPVDSEPTFKDVEPEIEIEE